MSARLPHWLHEESAAWHRLAAVLFFAALFCQFLNPITLISDFWWHLATGRWIVEHQALPALDPFLATSSPNIDLRQAVILKGYWLAQVLFFLVQKFFGDIGPVILKAGIISAIYVALAATFRRSGLGLLQSCAAAAPFVIFAREYDELRPHLFSFLGLILLFHLLEGGLVDGVADVDLRRNRLKFVPLLMLVWANLHPGFVLGSFVIVIYGVCEGGERFLRRRPGSGLSLATGLLLVAALLLSLCNPEGVNPYRLILLEQNFGSSRFAESVTEFYPFWRYYGTVGRSYMIYVFVGLALVQTLTLLFDWRRVRLRHVLVYLLLLVLALMSFRYVIFYVLIGSALAVPILARWVLSGGRSRGLALVAIGIFILIFGSNLLGNKVIAGEAVQVRGANLAADYLQANAHAPNLFNDYELGGYLIWRLSPHYQPFIDARALDYEVFREYWKAKGGKKLVVFGKYQIGTTVTFIDNPSSRTIQPLIYSLLQDENWRLSYYNNNFAVFARVNALTAADRLFKQHFIDGLLDNYRQRVTAEPSNVSHRLTIGQLLLAGGDRSGAHAAFLQAQQVAPGDQRIKQWLSIVSRKIDVYN